MSVQRTKTMRQHKTAGTSLIEILVVIVVFLVGILGLIQVFPPGLSALRNTAANQTARALTDSEIQRISGDRYGIPDYISTGQHVSTPSGLHFFVDASQPTRELMPPKDPDPAPGLLDANGVIQVGGGPLGDWKRLGASNRIARVLGEGHKIGAPKGVGAQYGALVHLTFAPIYYFPLPSGVGEPGVLQVYGNDLARRFGDRKTANPVPASFGTAREYEFFFVDRDKSDPFGPFTGQEQIWLGPAVAKDIRIALSFSYDSGAATPEQYDSVLVVGLDPLAPPPFATIVDNYWVVSLPDLVGQPDIYGRVLYNPANVLGVNRDSVRVQRLFQEIPVANAFDPTNPYQYKSLDGNFGTLLVNPAAFDFAVRTESGRTVPLLANCDYTVFDWRILRDEFRVPVVAGDVKLMMSSIKALNQVSVDSLRYPGLGFDVPALSAAGALQVRPDDFVLQDLETGGIILGNMGDATNPAAGYNVNKTRGYIQMRNGGGGGSLNVPVAYATGDPVTPWAVVTEDVAGHAVRALYMARGEWSVQVYRSAARYRTTDIVAANGLQAMECFAPRPGSPVGQPTRLYFPLADLGQRVNVGEIWYTDDAGNLRTLANQNLIIDRVENVMGRDHAYADLKPMIDPGATNIPMLNFSRGYSVRRVRGASMTVRVLHNDAVLNLTSDPVENFNRLEVWARTWRRHETESFVLGGAN